MTQYKCPFEKIKEKRILNWIIWDRKSSQLIELTNDEFKNGLNNHAIKLTGEYVLYSNMKERIWIDGIID